MRTTVELPDDLLDRARRHAAESGLTLKQFFITAIENSMASPVKVRREPPAIDGPANLRLLTSEEIDEAMFG